MNLLFVANRIPYPPHRGDKLKIYNLCRRLAAKNDLTLITFYENKSELKYKPELDKIFKTIHLIYLPKWKSKANVLLNIFGNIPFQVAYFKSNKFQNKLDKILSNNKFDAIHVQHMRMAPYFKLHTHLPAILDMPDAFSLYWKRRKKTKNNLFFKAFNALEYKRVLKYEKIIDTFKMSLVCSPKDKQYLEKTHNSTNINLLPNGVDLETFNCQKHNYSIQNRILFTGNMDYAPNVDGVLYFVENIWKHIHEKFPEVVLVIAGQRPVASIKKLASNHIKVTGFVENIAVEYSKSTLLIAPLRFGAGTQNKILEAMAMAVPVVCSPQAFVGIDAKEGEGILEAKTEKEFVEKISLLLQNQHYRQEIGEKGLKTIQQKYDWDNITNLLKKYLTNVQSI